MSYEITASEYYVTGNVYSRMRVLLWKDAIYTLTQLSIVSLQVKFVSQAVYSELSEIIQ